jgi:hypothetical protein
VSAWDLAATTEESWRLEGERARKESAHKRLGFGDFDAYLRSTIGKTEDEAKECFKTDHDAAKNRGGNRRSQAARESIVESTNDTQTGRAQKHGVGMNTQPYLDRLARDRPDLLQEVQAGRLRPYAAARRAGIVKVKTPLEHLRHWWGKTTPAQRRELRRWLKDQE